MKQIEYRDQSVWKRQFLIASASASIDFFFTASASVNFFITASASTSLKSATSRRFRFRFRFRHSDWIIAPESHTVVQFNTPPQSHTAALLNTARELGHFPAFFRLDLLILPSSPPRLSGNSREMVQGDLFYLFFLLQQIFCRFSGFFPPVCFICFIRLCRVLLAFRFSLRGFSLSVFSCVFVGSVEARSRTKRRRRRKRRRTRRRRTRPSWRWLHDGLLRRS